MTALTTTLRDPGSGLSAPTAATVSGPGASSGIRPRTAAGNVSACAT